MATLAAVIEDHDCHTLADGVLVHTARQDAALNVRNAATVGGTVVVAPVDSEFILALLALNAELSIYSDGIVIQPLDQFLSDPTTALVGGLIAQVRIHLPMRAAGGLARTTRTPSDHPIVAAVAVVSESSLRQGNGDEGTGRIAIGGVSPRPLLITLDRMEEVETPITQAIESAEPYQDFRGSAEYRRELGVLLALRALDDALAHR
jgi:carbon-monoxide dehydrogenase medium subunit